MYPTLSDLLKDLFGINVPLPIQMFGFMVAMAFIIGHYVIVAELRRKKELGLFTPTKRTEVEGLPASRNELITNGVFGFLLGYKLIYIIANYAAFTQNPPGFVLSTDGNFLAGIIGAAGLAYYTYYEKQKTKLEKPINKEYEVYPHDLMGTIIIIAAVAGLLGAKIFHNLENWDSFVKDPIDALLSFSGLTFYGGLIVGLAAVYYYARKNKIPFIHLIDGAAPGLMLAYGIGRVGCQLSGDGDWGIVNTLAKPEFLSFLPDWAWAYKYPHNVLGEGVQIAGCVGRHCAELPMAVFPTPLYEAIMAFVIFGFLWSIRKRINITGMMFSLYLFLNGMERFFIEKIRVNTLYHIFGKGFTQAELISSILMILGLIGMYISYKNYRKNEVSR
jgi:phosphatidylglycerol:prolipoprotein diacylglycerol transferase